MSSTSMSFKEYLDEKARLAMPADEALKSLTGGSERLNAHAWTDEQIQAIPEELVQFAYEHSEALRKEFSSLATFLAYRRACAKGQVRVGGR